MSEGKFPPPSSLSADIIGILICDHCIFILWSCGVRIMGDGALIVPSHRENKYDIYKAVKTKSSGSKSANIHVWICLFFE